MPSFDPTITLGTALAALSIIAGTWAAASRLYSLIDKRLAILESTLRDHAVALQAHAARMEKGEDMSGRLAGEMQRVIGRLESWADMRSRTRETDR